MGRRLTAGLLAAGLLALAVVLALSHGLLLKTAPKTVVAPAAPTDTDASPAPPSPPTTLAELPPADPSPSPTLSPPPVTLAAPDLQAWKQAVARIEEKRDVPGRIDVPSELEHYDDRRRFLAIQMAVARERDLELPHDEAALAEMILRGELVELAPLGEDYLLYDVGTDVQEDPLTHFDLESGKDVPLVGSADEYEREEARLAAEGAGRGAAAARARDRRERLASFYRDPARRELLFREHAAVTRLAADFGGVSYELRNPLDRARFQARLLSFIRTAARDVLLQLARGYRRRFDRLMPVASLVRTLRYQRRLARLNPNASRVEIPPHSTGLAFDVSYRFMTPEEQNFLMADVARLKDEGRVEALREARNSIHVFVLPDGRRPPETLIAQFLDDVAAAHPRAALRRAAPMPARARLRAGSRGRLGR